MLKFRQRKVNSFVLEDVSQCISVFSSSESESSVMSLVVASLAVLRAEYSLCSNSSQLINGELISVTWIIRHEAEPSLLTLRLYSMCSVRAIAVVGRTSVAMRARKMNNRFILLKLLSPVNI